MNCEKSCGECYWFDPENEIDDEKGCCMRFLIHVEENTIADNCFREGKERPVKCPLDKHLDEYIKVAYKSPVTDEKQRKIIADSIAFKMWAQYQREYESGK